LRPGPKSAPGTGGHMALQHHDLDPKRPEKAIEEAAVYQAAWDKMQAALADGVWHPVRALYRVVPDELVFTRFHWPRRSGWPRPARRSAVTPEQHADAGPDPTRGSASGGRHRGTS